MGRHQPSNLELLTRRGQETLGLIRKFLTDFTSDRSRSTEENISVLGWRILSDGPTWFVTLSLLSG